MIPEIQNVTKIMEDKPKFSIMPAVVTILLTIMASALLYALFVMTIPPENKDYVMLLLGTTFTLWSSSISYWIGTTRSSSEKDKKKP